MVFHERMNNVFFYPYYFIIVNDNYSHLMNLPL